MATTLADQDDALRQFFSEARGEAIVTEPPLGEPVGPGFRSETQADPARAQAHAVPAEVQADLAPTVRAEAPTDLAHTVPAKAPPVMAERMSAVARLARDFYARPMALPRQSLAMFNRAWAVDSSTGHAQGWHALLLAFACGTAVGAVVMFLFGVRPALGIATPQERPAPVEATASTLPPAPAPTGDARVLRETRLGETASGEPASREVASGETASRGPASRVPASGGPVLSGPTVRAAALMPAAPTRTATSGDSGRGARPAAAVRSRPPAVTQQGATARALQSPRAIPPPRATPFQGSLVVQSWPPGAQVFVNGESVGSTPLVLRGVTAGSRALRIEADEYRPWSAAISVIANQQTRVSARLERPIVEASQAPPQDP